MNGKRAKKLRRTANYLLKAWIVRNTNNDTDINDPMLANYLPKDPYFVDNTTRKTNFYTQKWAVKKLKRLMKAKQTINLDLKLEEMV